MPLRVPPAVLALFVAAALAGPAHAAEADLSNASPAELEALIQQSPARGAPSDASLRRIEAMYRLGDLRGDTTMIRAGADAASAALSALEAGGRGALWVTANKHLGTALVMLARRGNDRTRLDEAIAAFESATLFARDSVPEQWPGLMNSMGIAQWTKGNLARDPSQVRQAAATFRSALDNGAVPVSDREKIRLQVNLASALVDLATMASEEAPLDEAIERYNAALASAAAMGGGTQQAILQGNLAQALTIRGSNRRSIDDLEQAVKLTKTAIAYWTSIGATDALNEADANLRQTLALLTELYNAR
ncbi:hypothetical protein [Iodidimonas sp. SYSU 1G8]|uniref:hypothetical protein n=1 Tax=Iodidimonas sp. SYSU 1G8 TaxID=3133967 RepID=UPI0031FEDFAE